MQPASVDLPRWRSLAERLALPLADDVGQALIAAYDEPHRAYHTREHLAACLGWCDALTASLERPAEVELAFWFHDAIYDTHASDNEERSADWAARELEIAGASTEVRERVHAHVMATVHGVEDLVGDTAWLVDIDLAILGTPSHVYERYEEQVGREYAWVPGPIFRSKRAQILQGFLDRPAIYVQALMRERLEDRARANLAWAIEALGRRPR